MVGFLSGLITHFNIKLIDNVLKDEVMIDCSVGSRLHAISSGPSSAI